MSRSRFPSFPALALLAFAPLAQAELSAERVLTCMRDNLPPAVQVQAFEMETQRGDHAPERLTGRLYAQRQTRGPSQGLSEAMLRVESPEPLRGAAYLVRQSPDYLRDGMYVYMPALRRVRRVTGTFADGALMGSSFSYFDFKQLVGAFGGLTPQRSEAETLEGRDVHVLHFDGVQTADVRYTHVTTWVDRVTCVPLKVEFFEGDRLRKRLSVDPAALRPYGRYWYTSESTLVDFQERITSVLRVTQIKNADQIPQRFFDPGQFYRGL